MINTSIPLDCFQTIAQIGYGINKTRNMPCHAKNLRPICSQHDLKPGKGRYIIRAILSHVKILNLFDRCSWFLLSFDVFKKPLRSLSWRLCNCDTSSHAGTLTQHTLRLVSRWKLYTTGQGETWQVWGHPALDQTIAQSSYSPRLPARNNSVISCGKYP